VTGKPWEVDLSIYASEDELLGGLRRQEPAACTCFLKEYAPRMLRLALRITGDPDEAENVLQESFISACNRIDDFQGLSTLNTWMYRIVLNNALMSLRRKRPDTVPLEAHDTHAGQGPNWTDDYIAQPVEEVLAAELQESLNLALLALPERLRTAFVLRELEGLSTREAAEALEISESALKVRLHRARQALREQLGPYLGPASERG
jgi:RNA polymerase sigma-70 factor, ECF subfamily